MNYTYYDFSNIGGLHTVRFKTKEHIMNALGLYQYTTRPEHCRSTWENLWQSSPTPVFLGVCRHPQPCPSPDVSQPVPEFRGSSWRRSVVWASGSLEISLPWSLARPDDSVTSAAVASRPVYRAVCNCARDVLVTTTTVGTCCCSYSCWYLMLLSQ